MTDKQKELELLHEQWLKHPVTKTALDIITKHEKHISDTIAAQSGTESVSDGKIRQFAVQLKTVQTIRTVMFSTSEFVMKVKQ